MFDKILVATDSPTVVDGAGFTAVEMAAQNAAELYVLHVLESSYSGKYRQFVRHFQTGEEIVADRAYEEFVKKELERAYADILGWVGHYTIRVTAGTPWQEILRWAREEQVELIVLGPHSKRAQQEGFERGTDAIGSTVEGVVSRERCPVMIVNDPARREQLRFKRILATVDFSNSCKYALRFAIDLAETTGARLLVFHVAPVPPEPLPEKADHQKKIDALAAKLRALAKDIPKGLKAEFTVREGALPYLEILKYAAEQGVDLIVMGSHTKKDGERPYVGSAVVQVSCQALRPVVVVNALKAMPAAKSRSSRAHPQRKTAATYQPARLH